MWSGGRMDQAVEINTNAEVDFDELVARTKCLTNFKPEHEAILLKVGDVIKPHLGVVTASFYEVLVTIPKAQPFLDGRIDVLKQGHQKWLESLFTGPFDETFARNMYHVGSVHVKVKLPVEFMQGAATLIMGELIKLVTHLCREDAAKQGLILTAINGVIGYSVAIMQESYQASSLAEELEKFLAITGMSRALFNNLALAYNAS